ncbi:MAG: Coenzyme F420 hydrogenase/dehydrogenase, beta subunit C-terminal domain [Lentimicrobium sp.]
MNKPKVIVSVVNNDLCIGCGLCVYKCPNNALEMNWNQFGFIIPELAGNCSSDGSCITVCPFNPIPDDEVKTENELAEIFLTENKHQHLKIGKYINIYAGFSNEFRLTSSSGGIATYIFTELLEKGIVDYIFSVKESQKSGVYYEYAVSSSKEELLYASKTRYFPVTLGTVITKVHELKGKVAIVGVACFIKAIRLAQHKEPALNEKIPFLVGIICGGVKSRFFTDYLAGRAGVANQNVMKPEFRIKDLKSTASDYSFGCLNKEGIMEHTIKMRSVGDMWGTGMFKANACDFCDDVTTELADISLGDAWLPPFNTEGAGTNVIVTRSEIAEKLIQDGIKESKLTIEPLPQDQFLASQQGSYNHRHKGLSYRIKQAKKKNQAVPPKRFDKDELTIDFKVVQKYRMKIRQKSLVIWAEKHDAMLFDETMKKYLLQLKLATKVYHYRRVIKSKISNI